VAQNVNQVVLRSPGFQGLNTELSPINGDPEFALTADNVVIDQIGRLCAREAFATYRTLAGKPNIEFTKMSGFISKVTEDGRHQESPVSVYRYGNMEPVSFKVELQDGLGVRRSQRNLEELESGANYGVAILEDDALVDTPVPAGVGQNLRSSEFAMFKDETFLFAKNSPFMVLNNKAWDVVGGKAILGTDASGNPSQDINGDIAISAYGRLWVSGVDGDYHKIYYSSLLNEKSWYDPRIPPEYDTNGDITNGPYDPPFNPQNDGGVIDVREYWPVGADSIVNIHAHNGFLLVFGRNSILIYANANSDPAGENGIQLQDAISNVGLVRRDAICNIGTDVLFVDDTGVRSIGRVIQEKSSPVTEASLNIRKTIQQAIKQELAVDTSRSAIKMEYMPSKSMAVVLFRNLELAFTMQTNMPSKTGGLKVTRWRDCRWNDSFEANRGDEDIVYLAGRPNRGLMKYQGYLQDETYEMSYMGMAIGQAPFQQVMPKSVIYTIYSNSLPGDATANWGFGDRVVGNYDFRINSDSPGSSFAVDEFDIGQYGLGDSYYFNYKVHTSGSGELFRVGLDIEIKGDYFALQEISINSAIGRISA
jgi:hypothetical protein